MKRYILFNKPYGVLSQFTGEPGQKTLADFNLPQDIYAAGRLDKDSEGLLLLTNDSPLIEKLLNPDNAHPRTYLVQVDGVPGQQDLDKLMGTSKNVKFGLFALPGAVGSLNQMPRREGIRACAYHFAASRWS